MHIYFIIAALAVILTNYSEIFDCPMAKTKNNQINTSQKIKKLISPAP
jgi:hypothetical protein